MTSQEPPVRELHYAISWLTPGFQQLSTGDHGPACRHPLPRRERPPRRAAAPRSRDDLDEVRDQLQQALDVWALELELKRGCRVAFRLTGTAWDDAPVPGQHRAFRRGVHEYLSPAGDFAAVAVRASLPAPSGDIASTPEVRRWLERLRAVQDGREPAPSAAYAMITHLKLHYGAGSIPNAAAALHVSGGLLHRLSQVASRYHPTKGRKTDRGQEVLTDADLAWLEQAMVLLVRRLAEVVAGGSNLPELTVADVS